MDKILMRTAQYPLAILLWVNFTATTLLCGNNALAQAGGTSSASPNVVFILADDLGIADIGAYGQQTIQTPSLDLMAAGGMKFAHMFSGAPVCSPSRATLFTGLHNGRFNNGNGVSLQAGTVTVAQTLRTAGYATAMFGKLHLNGSNRLTGFDQFYGLTDGVEAWDHFNPWLQRGVADASGQITTLVQEPTNGGYTDDLIAAETVQFIRNQANSSQPFYAQLNFQIAHFDLEVPILEPYTTSLNVPEQEKIHASMVTRMDRRIGELLQALDDPNNDGNTSDSIASNTIVMFASDNGAAIEGSNPAAGTGPHDPETFDSNGIYRGHKRDLYNGGILSPFIVQWKDTITGSTSDHFGDFSDILPTVAEIAGVDAPVGIDGESFGHILTGQDPSAPTTRDDHYFEFTGGFFTNSANGDEVGPSTSSPPRLALVRDGLKAIRFADGHTELYNLFGDPSESNDLFAQSPGLANDMIAEALAQDTGPVSYLNWTGTPSTGAGTIASLVRQQAGAGVEQVTSNFSMLGLEIGAAQGTQLLRVDSATITARNGARVRSSAEMRLENGSFATVRRLEVQTGGKLAGHGRVFGQLLNAGIVDPSGELGSGPTIAFDFNGVQDDAPLNATTRLHSALRLVNGLDFGSGTLPRSAGPDGFTGSDAGNEFNVGGFDSSSLAGAIANNDFITYTVEPVDGLSMTLLSASFRLWRNGINAANDYAILTSLDGFSPDAAVATLNNVFDSGPSSSRDFTATYNGPATTDPVEIRLYGWNANDGLANTHINNVTLDAVFTSLSGEEFAPTGRLTLAGDYVQQGDGLLAIELGIAGLSDQLVVMGNAYLAGELMIDIAPGIELDTGAQFTVVEIDGVRSGLFGGLHEGDVFAVDDVWLRVSYLAGDGNDVGLTVVPRRRRVGYLAGDEGPTAVPEPSTMTVWTLTFLAISRRADGRLHHRNVRNTRKSIGAAGSASERPGSARC